MSPKPHWNQTCIEPVPAEARLAHIRFCSPFAASLIDRHPDWIEQLSASHRFDEISPPDSTRASEWVSAHGLDDGLRGFRNQEMLRIIWRDLNGLATLGEVLSDLTTLAGICIQAALDAHQGLLEERFGQPLDAKGRPQKLIVLGLGKLGGGELNLSSDIDLIFCYPSDGKCDGPRSLTNNEFFSKLSREVISSLSAVRAAGFCFRVDTRLRPYGQVGSIANHFSAMEQYYQREGRNWERYALIKARPVAGDVEAGNHLLEILRPFVYRRYIDFGAIEALREMQTLIQSEAIRAERVSDVKRGPGGIREIEFLAQGYQLLRGGQETTLQTPSLAEAMEAITRLQLLSEDLVNRLTSHYTSLRFIENRIQAMRDQQTHKVRKGEDFQRLKQGMGIKSDEQLTSRIALIRAEVSAAFDDSWAGSVHPKPETDSSTAEDLAWQHRWLRWRSSGQVDTETDDDRAALLNSFLSGLARRPLGTSAGRRLDSFMPVLLQRFESHPLSNDVVGQLLDLVLTVSQRSAYLALLAENPQALDRAIELFGRSQWVARRVIRFPALLDELIDPALGHHIPDRVALEKAALRKIRPVDKPEDEESALAGLNYLKQATGLRLAVAWLEGRIDETEVQLALSHLAEVMIGMTMELARRRLERRHGIIENSALAVIGYGSLGARELGFSSDLDLVFLYRAGDGESDGERPLAPERWFARLAQRMVGLLTALTPSGKLYEIDTRLRPNGQSGLLVSSINAYSTYQRQDAWTWESQALTRARAVAGDHDLISEFREIRRECLCRKRDRKELGQDLMDMRARVRESFPSRSGSATDTRHSPGGMVDISFLAQLGVLSLARELPQIIEETSVSGQLERLQICGWLNDEQGALIETHLAELRKIRLSDELAPDQRPPDAPGLCKNGSTIAEIFVRLASEHDLQSHED
ncbi:MAG TPA: bifunctional [glutamate--ammonia ligase]-adenylyl-L-tyrosine phosphorylase/[glutamate--ammonia-ligase] adenylyltransferase [Xanthomonadales bacterium]|nr:bifunctional [glutamate--ammonia ligase]-adenylyl-L-tyrosine phosphorylase/[glutamate--ammonia-ligase] adenylyltransferase [Xanthomonadales bacterium]